MSGALSVSGLSVSFANGAERVRVVSDVDFELVPGTILGLAGESGCGKSTTLLSTMGFEAPGGRRDAGSVSVGPVEVTALPLRDRRGLWGRQIAYVAQDASASLSPLVRIGSLFDELLVRHLDLSAAERRERTVSLLESVGLDDPRGAARRYPHQFSGGQQQRIALALALACEPEVLLFDEPTTGLDVTTQARISKLIRELVRDRQVAALFVSHDLALLGELCDEIAIMYAGQIVEHGPADAIFRDSRHPYSRALLDSIPAIEAASLPVGIAGAPPSAVVPDRCAFADRCRFRRDVCVAGAPPLVEIAPGHAVRCIRTAELGAVPPATPETPPPRVAAPAGTPVLAVAGLVSRHRGRDAPAVDDVSLEVAPGEVLGVVGESGSGKTTLLRTIAGLHPQAAGEVRFMGAALPARADRRSRQARQAIQLVFQNPDASLNPRQSVARQIARPLTLFRPDLSGAGRRTRLLELAEQVQLDPSALDRYPHQLSGGQKQRVAIARALAADPRLLLCDEVVSALDVSVQAAILGLLSDLAATADGALVFVTHDLAVVRSLADRICVMKDGRVREVADTEQLFLSPRDAYTRELLAAMPRLAVS